MPSRADCGALSCSMRRHLSMCTRTTHGTRRAGARRKRLRGAARPPADNSRTTSRSTASCLPVALRALDAEEAKPPKALM